MLTDQHNFVTRLLNPQYIQEYRSHMCGVCHSLSANFHLPARMLTSHDLVLLSILSEAQANQTFNTTYQQCPISLTKSNPSILDTSTIYSAAIGVILATLKLEDDANDEPQHHSFIRVGRKLTRSSYEHALIIAQPLGLNVSALGDFSILQKTVEKESGISPDSPTAQLAQDIFEVTAKIAGDPTNCTALKGLGYSYGRYIYWMDAFRDFPRDVISEKFNPLSRYATKGDLEYGLTIEGLSYIQSVFSGIRQNMEFNLAQLNLMRHKELLEMLVLKPIDEIIIGIDTRIQRAQPLTFKHFSAMDIARAGLFLLPVVSVTAFVTNHQDQIITQANACMNSTQDVIMHGITSSGTSMRMLGFGLGNADWLRDILPGISEIGDGPCTAICNGPCSSICDATNPAACCRPNPDVGSNCWTCGGSGCLNACETLF